MIQNYFNEVENLDYKEGYDLIKKYYIYPYCPLSVLDRPGLFIDATSLLEFIRSKESDFEFNLLPIQDRKIDKLVEWKDHNPDGQIVIVLEDKTLLPSKIALEKDSPDMQTLMLVLIYGFTN